MELNDMKMSIPSGKLVQLNQWRFRKTVLSYLKANANPKISLKLMQISRYFCFTEFPYVIAESLVFFFGDWKYIPLGQLHSGYQILDLDNLTKPLWIQNVLHLCYSDDLNLLSHLLLKTGVCDLNHLHFSGQKIKINEFQFLVSSKIVEVVTLHKTQIVFDDGESIVPVEEIVKELPKLKKFTWTFTDDTSEITPTSTAKLISQLNPAILTHCYLMEIPEIFDFKLFAKFMDNNPSISFNLRFNGSLSGEYANFLQAYVEKLIKTGYYKNRKIVIHFPQQDAQFYIILHKHFCNACNF